MHIPVGALPVKQESITYSGSNYLTSSPIIADLICTGIEEGLEQCTTNLTSLQMLQECSGNVVSAAICQS